MSNHFSLRSPLLYFGLALAVLLGAFTYAWYDHLVAGGETVAGNVEYAGERLDARTSDQVREFVADRSADVLSREVSIATPDGTISLQLDEVGFYYDVDRAVDRVLSARHTGGVLEQFTKWVATLTTTEHISEPISFDPAAAQQTLYAQPGLVFESPVSPDIALNDEWRLEVVPGVPGSAADVEILVEDIGGLDPTDTELAVDAIAVEVPADFTDEMAASVADRLNELTQSGARLIIDGDIRQMAPAALRRHLTVSIEGNEMVPVFDHPGLQAEIEATYPGPIGDAVSPSFEVDGEAVAVLAPGKPAEICCSANTAQKLGDAILAGASGPFVLTTRPDDDPTRTAWYDGSLIVERVSSFTTPHSCCENRVINIQRMADLVRGFYLVPGQVISLNEHVGPRTAEKGFVPAGAIRSGHLVPEIGGGVSQFATTIFNAAYFAGLDFVQYQAHSLYFSRYPFGREATISNPAPDLVFENTTDYPVLIWTSYTPSSITVSMYSTKNIEVEQVATRTSSRNQCTYVETDRERVYADGRTEIDTFWALYRPADGIDCNGNPIPESPPA
ncbi:MAG: VanW family protein [Acidimicrobiia bacterium]